MEVKRFESENKNVIKYVFTTEDMVAEAVLYKYNDYYNRTVICCSTQSGCPVGCNFCGTGKKFLRNLTSEEIIYQIDHILKDRNIENIDQCKKFQIMFMSMGEPFLNYDNVESAILKLNRKYPNASLLISTIMPKALNKHWLKFLALSQEIHKIGLQISIHKSSDAERDILIPFKEKFNLEEIRDLGIVWNKLTNRFVYLNYCVDGTNNKKEDLVALQQLFSPVCFNFTFSVICSKDETVKNAGFKNLDIIQDLEESFLSKGYDTRIFNPEGQDDIGGGCGQLWYVQEYMKKLKG